MRHELAFEPDLDREAAERVSEAVRAELARLTREDRKERRLERLEHRALDWMIFLSERILASKEDWIEKSTLTRKSRHSRDECLYAAHAIAITFWQVSEPEDIAKEALRLALCIERGMKSPAIHPWRMKHGLDDQQTLADVIEAENRANITSHPHYKLRVDLMRHWGLCCIPRGVDVADAVINAYFGIVIDSPEGRRNWRILMHTLEGKGAAEIARITNTDRRTVARTVQRQFAKLGNLFEPSMPNSRAFPGPIRLPRATWQKNIDGEKDARFAPELSFNAALKKLSRPIHPVLGLFRTIVDSDLFGRSANRKRHLCHTVYEEGDRRSWLTCCECTGQSAPTHRAIWVRTYKPSRSAAAPTPSKAKASCQCPRGRIPEKAHLPDNDPEAWHHPLGSRAGRRGNRRTMRCDVCKGTWVQVSCR
jgi:hypothetical protein